MAEILIGDLETNAIHYPNMIHMVGIVDFYTGEYTSYHGENVADGLVRLSQASLVIGHNFRDYDAYHIERLTEGLVVIDPKKIADTLHLSRKLVPEFQSHKLSVWGDALGFPKLIHKDFERYTPEMDEYCRRDCDLTRAIFLFMIEHFPEQTIPLLEKNEY